jgi:ATP-dependent DNA helicase RecQ
LLYHATGLYMISPATILQQYWGFSNFRPLQQDIIESVLSDKDTLALMPTGGGKSLCYQVPALCRPGVCLVISPLIALMKDQVENLRKKNITAYAIHTGMNRKEVEKVLQTAGKSNCKFLYVSPERLESRLFQEYLPALQVNLVAVDEAHCISQWGYDFRPPYSRIANLREQLPGVPVLALTASATPEVQQDICDKLQPAGAIKNNWAVFRQSFERANLSYSVFEEPVFITKIVDILNKVPGTAIVYCRTRKQTRDISEQLSLQQIAADYYHGGLTQEERNARQEAWINNKIKVIVCTNAFGMGIDKPDVRLVIHAGVPDCLENYYQEAGRAGRDGKK